MIIVRNNLLVKDILTKVDHSSRLSKWCIELTEFDSKYEPRKAIKSQALANFMLELPRGAEETEPIRTLEWASRADRKWAGLVLQGLEGMKVTKSIKFSFLVTNNVAEYETLMSGLELAERVQIKSLQVYSDSNLLVQQMNGEYDIKDPTLKKYVDLAKDFFQSSPNSKSRKSVDPLMQEQIPCQRHQHTTKKGTHL